MATSGAKQNYKLKSRLEVFYTGGAVRVSNDGAVLACACGEEVKLVDLETGAVTKTFPGDSEPITALALSPDGRTVFTASRSLQLKFWSVETGKTLRSVKAHKAPIADMAVDPSGGMLATASADRTARVWDTDGGFCTHSFGGHSGIILSLAFHPRQLMLFTAGDDSQVRVWDLVTKSCIANLKGHFSAVTSLSLSYDGWSLLSGGRDGVVLSWDLRKYEKIATIPIYEAVEGVVALPPKTARTFLPEKESNSSISDKDVPLVFAIGGEKGVVKVFRVDTAQQVGVQSMQTGEAPTLAGGIVELRALPASSSGKAGRKKSHGCLVAATQDCRLLALEATTPPATSTSTSTSTGSSQSACLTVHRQLVGNNDDVTDVRFITCPELETSTTTTTTAKNSITHVTSASSGKESGGPSHIVASTNSEHIRVFDTAALGCVATLAGHSDIVLCLDAVRLLGGSTLVVSGSKDNSVRLWALPQSQCIGIGTGHIAAVGAVAFSRKNHNFFVSGGTDKLLKVWDLSTLALDVTSPVKMRAMTTVAAHDKDINAVAVAPNDSLVCTGSQDRTAKIWQLPDLVLSLTLKGHRRGVWSVAFSPSDKVVVTGSGDKTIKLWSLKDGACLRTFEGHVASVLRVDFLTSGSQLISSGADGLLKLWSVKSSECVNTFDAHDDKVWALAVDSAATAAGGGRLLVSGSGDGSIAIWEDSTGADEEERVKDRESEVLKEQDLANALQMQDYEKAAALALEMRRPGKLLAVVNSAFQQGPERGTVILERLVENMSYDSVKLCLEYCREWNTNSKTCFVAQVVLQAIFKRHSPQALMAVPGMRVLLEGLLSYTQRHFSRVDRLLRSTFLVDYVLGVMNVLTPLEGEDNEDEQGLGGVNGHTHAHGNGVVDIHANEIENDDERLNAEAEAATEEDPVIVKKKKNKDSSIGKKTSSRTTRSKTTITTTTTMDKDNKPASSVKKSKKRKAS